MKLWTPYSQTKPRFEWQPRINPEHPLAQGLVGCWLMNEGAGAKAFGQPHLDGTLTSTSWDRYGLGTGTTGRLSVIDNAQFDVIKNGLTLLVRVRLQSVTGTQTLAGKWSIVGYSFIMYLSGTTLTLALSSNGTTNQHTISSVGAVSSGVWYDLCMTYDGSSSQLFRNGSKIGNPGSFSGTLWDTTAPFQVSGNDASNYVVNGSIAHALLWSRALSAGEIASLYARPYQFLTLPKRRTIITPATTGGTTLAADVATATGAALNATVSAGAVSLTAGLATSTGASLSATLSPGAVTRTTGSAPATGSALNATVTPGAVTLEGGTATGTGQAYNAQAKSGLTSGCAIGTGQAFAAIISTSGTTAVMGIALGTGSAFDCTIKIAEIVIPKHAHRIPTVPRITGNVVEVIGSVVHRKTRRTENIM